MIAKGGGVAALVGMLQGGTDGAKQAAAGALRSLCRAAEMRKQITAAGGVDALLSLANTQATWLREHILPEGLTPSDAASGRFPADVTFSGSSGGALVAGSNFSLPGLFIR